jgi:hypothetical protein
MADQTGQKRDRKHFYLKEPKTHVFAFSPKLPPFEKKLLPKAQRQKQAAKIKTEIDVAIKKGLEAIENADEAIADPKKQGFYLQLKLSDALGFIDGLENASKKIFIKNISVVDPEKGIISVVVYVPKKSAEHYKALADRYAAKANEQKPSIVDEAVAHIDSVKNALFKELYTDALEKLPPENHVIWWEVWLDFDYKDRAAEIFKKLGLEFQTRVMSFAESSIYHVKASQRQLLKIIKSTDLISEIRLPQKQPGFFLSVLKPHEQAEWIADVVKRRTFDQNPKVKICLLDTGVNQKHPLLDGIVPDSHANSHNPLWGSDDQRNHGTPMSSIALYGDLYQHLSGKGAVDIGHGLISIKVLPEEGFPANEPEFYGLIIEESVQRADVIDAASNKVICYAITHPEEIATGRPSITSSYVDKLAMGLNDVRRLFVLAGGNIPDDILQAHYDDVNVMSPVEDPGQSWNAITVGGYTEKTAIKTYSAGDEKPLAQAGGLSPRSRTSCVWLENWPIKPDVVFEGGNLCYKDTSIPCEWHEDLSLVAAAGTQPVNLFTRMADSSAATALASKMCAEIQTANPALWPETVRALLVHSAEWTTTMRHEIFEQVSKTQRIRRHIRKYGHGVPSLARALFSMSNDLTMVIEDTIVPFKTGATAATFNQIKLYDLPWPIDALNSVGAADAELKVTLSYYIEPNPGKPIISRKRTYQSSGLQFEIRRPKESDLDFKNRVNKLQMLEEGDNPLAVLSEEPVSEDGDWVLGKRGRNVGSLHSDTWMGSAAALANRGKICVYPRAGWWKHNKKLKRWTSSMRFSLVVSIRTPAQEVDLYAAVDTAIKNQTATKIAIKT